MAPTDDRDPEEHVPLSSAVFHILLVLGARPLHGYGIKKAVRRLSDDKVEIGSGTLYRSLQRMEVEGFVTRLDHLVDPDTDDDRRVYYQLTEFGREVACAEARRLGGLVNAALARGFLDGIRLWIPDAAPQVEPGEG